LRSFDLYLLVLVLLPEFFLQAEDGIRDFPVTGVQTCALPISPAPFPARRSSPRPQQPGIQSSLLLGGAGGVRTSFEAISTSRASSRRSLPAAGHSDRAALAGAGSRTSACRRWWTVR